MAARAISAAEGATGAHTAPAAAPDFRYAAFLSYSHLDKRAAARLHSFLENYRIPRALVGRVTARGPVPDRLRPIFRDREDLAAADDLSREIEAALAQSRALIVLCSPNAAVSRWTNIEIERFRALHGDSAIFAAILDGEPFASEHPARAADECFPPALRQRPTPEGPVRAEPVGADLRREGDGVQAGRLKLVAGLLGVPLDELVHRDARRRHRRTLALVVALLIGLGITSALAVLALQARNDAVRQRAEAEGLIEFMVTDLRKKLEPAGRLGAMDTLGARALDFYRRQDVASLDPDSLGRRARVVQLIGEIQDQRGNLDKALANFETAYTSTAELLARDPANVQRLFDHAQSAFWVGYIAYRRGNFTRAEAAFEQYRALAERLVALEPDSARWRAEIDYAYSNLGTLRFSEGRNAEAVQAFERSLAVSRDVAAAAPEDAAAQLAYATSLAWLSSARERLGELSAAAALRTQELAIVGRVLARDPDNNSAQLIALVAERALAGIARAQGRTDAAQAHAARAVADAELLLKTDAANTIWANNAAMAYIVLGEARLAAGNAAAAERALGRAMALTAKLNARDSGVSNWRLTQVHGRLLRAAILAARGDAAHALAVARAAEAAIGALPSAGRDVSEARWLLANAHLQAANAQRMLGDAAGAARDEQAIIDSRPPAGTAEEPRMAKLRARAAVALNADLGA